MAYSVRNSRRRRVLYKKNKRTSYSRRRTVSRRRRPAARGMQRIRKVKWPRRNIGGDRAYTKLFYVKGQNFGFAAGTAGSSVNQVMNVGSTVPGTPLLAHTLAGIMGSTPNLSTLGALYLNYRIRGIKIKLTYWQTSGEPVCLFTNAQSSKIHSDTSTGPSPAFPNPDVSILPEQRWSKYRVCQATAAGGKATSLSAYYSVNKVYGPDSVTKNDVNFTGEMGPAAPFWSQDNSINAHPTESPWLQFGLFTLSGEPAVEDTTGVLKVEQTVYTEFFGKRVSIA